MRSSAARWPILRRHGRKASSTPSTNGSARARWWQFEAVRIRKDGTQIDVESTISPIIDAAGRVLGASAISHEVTERKQVEAALRRERGALPRLFENATDLIATVDLDTRLTAVNAAFVRTLGYSREELLGRSLHDFVPTEWHDELKQASAGKMGDADADRLRARAARPRRTAHPVEVASRAILEDGVSVGIEAICRDISERKQLEEQLRQAQSWKRSAASPAASRTTSTTCSR